MFFQFLSVVSCNWYPFFIGCVQYTPVFLWRFLVRIDLSHPLFLFYILSVHFIFPIFLQHQISKISRCFFTIFLNVRVSGPYIFLSFKLKSDLFLINSLGKVWFNVLAAVIVSVTKFLKYRNCSTLSRSQFSTMLQIWLSLITFDLSLTNSIPYWNTNLRPYFQMLKHNVTHSLFNS